MKIAVASDVHDNIWNLEKALNAMRGRGVETLLFLGDFCAPFTLKQMADTLSCPIHAVFGNNDGDPFLLTTVASEYDHVTLHGQLAELELAGLAMALNHYPDIARRLAQSGAYAAVFSGHNHERQLETIGDTVWANPGEVMGRFGSPSWGFFDTETRQFDHVDL